MYAGHRPVHTWFLEITFIRMSVCFVRTCVCVHPQAVGNNSHEMKPGIQVVLYSDFSVQDLLSIELIGVALVTKRIAKGG